MSPGIEAALIGVGGSVIVAVVAFVTTWSVTRRTLRADRDERIWDKESTAYELALSGLLRLQIVRMKGQFSQGRPDLMAEYLAQRDSPDWVKAQGMLLAYAPQEVHDALDASVVCYVKAAECLRRLDSLRNHPDEEEPDAREIRLASVMDEFGKFMETVVEADKKDQELANAIRKQLGKGPVRLPLPSRPAIPDQVRRRLRSLR